MVWGFVIVYDVCGVVVKWFGLCWVVFFILFLFFFIC